VPVAPVADRAAIHRWFRSHGVPNFIDDYARPSRVLPRAALGAVVVVVVALVLAIVASASAGVVALAVVLGGVGGLLIAYVVVATGLVPLSLFGLGWLGRTIWRGGMRMLAVLPLLLVAVTFLFLGAETWQSIGRLRGLPLVLTALLFVGLGIVFVSRQVRPDLDAAVTFDDASALRAALPPELSWSDELVVSGVSADQHTEPADAPHDAALRRGERMNLRAMTTIAQLMVAVAVGVAVFGFFIVFGVLVVNADTAQSWLTAKPDIWWQATIAGHQYVLTSAHVRVSGFLGVFSAFYFVVSASTDTALRATLSEDAREHVQTCLAVRAVYRHLA
jgi:hypothetical protein